MTDDSFSLTDSDISYIRYQFWYSTFCQVCNLDQYTIYYLIYIIIYNILYIL